MTLTSRAKHALLAERGRPHLRAEVRDAGVDVSAVDQHPNLRNEVRVEREGVGPEHHEGGAVTLAEMSLWQKLSHGH